MNMRTESEIRAYVDGYNACFEQFCECLKGRKSVIDAIRKMKLYQAAVNDVVEKEKNDVVEVVRCKDCIYWRDSDHTCKHSFTSPKCANDYCSKGERKDD